MYYSFPKDLVNTMWNGKSGLTSVLILGSRFKWMSEKTFRIVNRSNLDCLFEMCTTDPDDASIEARYLKLKSVVKVDN